MADNDEWEPLATAAGEEDEPQRLYRPLVSYISAALCALIFLYIHGAGVLDDEAAMARIGYVGGGAIWEGNLLPLLQSAFIHIDFLHLLFNMYWLFILGVALERVIGWPKMALLVLSSAFVSSSFQLTISDTTGIGFSGVVYTIVGFLLLKRQAVPWLYAVLPNGTAGFLIIWLFVCIVLDAAGVMSIANGAHFAGFFWGLALAAGAVGWAYVGRPAAVALALSAVLVLAWSPWSVSWLAVQAYALHDAGDLEGAIAYYDRIISKDPQNAWAFHNRGAAHYSLGNFPASEADLERAAALDPSYR